MHLLTPAVSGTYSLMEEGLKETSRNRPIRLRISHGRQLCILAGIACVHLIMQSAQAQPVRFAIDSDSSRFLFTVAHLGMFDVNGSFREVAGFVEVDLATGVPVRTEIELQASSIFTDDSSRDENLRSEDFLDVQRHPVVRFKSLSIIPPDSSDGEYQIEGLITIFGVTRKLVAPFMFEIDGRINLKNDLGLIVNDASGKIEISTEFMLDREDFNLTFGRIMDAMIGDEIKVHVRIVARAQT